MTDLTPREIAKWCEATPERRKAVLRQLASLEPLGGKPSTRLADAQRMVYNAREAAPRFVDGPGPKTWLWLRSQKDLRVVARGEKTLEQITLGRCSARTSFGARRLFNNDGGAVITENDALAIIDDCRKILADAPDPLAMPRGE